MTTQARGSLGEKIARDYLEKQGFKYLAANWKCKTGELDLIMADGNERVIVEVRLRAPTHFGTGYETIQWQKQAKLIRTAKYYQQKENYWGDLRFDVVSIIDIPNQSPEIEHIKDAFTL